MANISVQNILIAIFGFILFAHLAEHMDKGVTPVVILLIVASTFGLAWCFNSADKQAEGLQTQPTDPETQICLMRKKILDYRPGEWTLRDVTDGFKRPSKIRIGVLGVQGSGKSTLLNSLHFAFTGTWKKIYDESPSSGAGGETIFRSFMKLTDHVTTVDTRGMVDFSARRVNDVMAEISGNRGIDPFHRHKGEKIDCPIFVFKYSVATGTHACKDFFTALIAEMKKRFDAYPIMVIPFGDSVANKDQILAEFVSQGKQESNVFFIENYTAGRHEMNQERHVALLKILDACILLADDNITFRWRKEKDIPWWKRWSNINTAPET